MPTDEEPGPEDPTPTEVRVLFVGNSLTFWNRGVDRQCEKLTADAGVITIEAERVVQGGATLEVLYSETEALARIESGDFDVVVLQEDIPETTVARFHEYARRFVTAIEEAGARPVLFMAWEYDRLGWITNAEIAAAHEEIADEIGAEIAPVALAWEASAQQRPDLDLYDSDDEHPSMAGTYLAAAVIYGTLAGASPEALSFTPSGVSTEDAAFLREIAEQERLAR